MAKKKISLRPEILLKHPMGGHHLGRSYAAGVPFFRYARHRNIARHLARVWQKSVEKQPKPYFNRAYHDFWDYVNLCRDRELFYDHDNQA